MSATPIRKIRYLRYSLLTIILGATIYLAFGNGLYAFESYCPFGGPESLWGLITTGEFSCALGPLNLSLMIALLVLTLIAKKSFCGWGCPIGFLSELSGRLGKIIWKNRLRVPTKVNNRIKLLRYVVLIVALFFTYNTGELILRGYDPFSLIFSESISHL